MDWRADALKLNAGQAKRGKRKRTLLNTYTENVNVPLSFSALEAPAPFAFAGLEQGGPRRERARENWTENIIQQGVLQ